MKVAVTRLRDRGRLLERPELPKPIVGRPQVSDWGGPHTANKHNSRMAEIWIKTYLKRKLMRYIRHYNKQPKPVKWKYFDPTKRITPDSIVTGQ